MKCFVAGTPILTLSGLVPIEEIQTGDKVISTNTDTFEVTEKTVVQTFIRESAELVHLTINGEIIKTTPEHPFYVKEQGFVNACKLKIGDELLDAEQNVLMVEDTYFEICKNPVKVYNFEVEDFHTYHVGQNNVLVHNANYPSEVNDLYDQSQPGKPTKGKTEQRMLEGDFDTVLNDFENLNPSNVRDIQTNYGPGKVGDLEDGFSAVARPDSSYGAPTLEIRNTRNGRGLEFRYE